MDDEPAADRIGAAQLADRMFRCDGLLSLNGRDLRREPTEKRKAALARLLRSQDPGIHAVVVAHSIYYATSMWGAFVKAVAWVAVLGIFADQAKAEASLNDVLRVYDSPDATAAQRLVISSNLVGIELGLGWANTALRVQSIQTRFYCPADRQEITPAELVDILRGAREAEPRLGDQPIGLALLSALQRAFPCNVTDGPSREKAASRSRRRLLTAKMTVRKSPAAAVGATRAVLARRALRADDRFAGAEAPFTPPPPASRSPDRANGFQVPPLSGTP